MGIALDHDSNITRTTDPHPDWTQSLFGGIGYEERSADLTARLLAQVQRRNFVHNTYPDDTIYFLNGVAVWTIAPQRLSWIVEDYANQSPLSLTAPNTPSNLVMTNSLSTGPELTFGVNPANMPVIGARYGRYDIEGSGDNQRYTGYARWPYQLSSLDKASLNYIATRIDFTPPATYPNFRRQDVFLRYERLSALGSLVVDGGTTYYQPYGGEGTKGGLGRVTALYTLTSESAVRLVLADQISDSATDLIRNVASVTATTVPVFPLEAAAAVPLSGSIVATGDVYRSQRAELTYVTRDGRIESGLQAYTRRVDYLTLNQQDYHEDGARLTLAWVQSSAVRIYADAYYLKRTFPSLDERDSGRIGALGVTYRLTPTLLVSAEAGRIERESNIPLQNFVDRRVLLLLGYSTGPLYSPSRLYGR